MDLTPKPEMDPTIVAQIILLYFLNLFWHIFLGGFGGFDVHCPWGPVTETVEAAVPSRS